METTNEELQSTIEELETMNEELHARSTEPNLVNAFPVERLGRPLRACLSEDVVLPTTTLNATNRRGKSITCDVTCMPLVGPRSEVRGAILIMESRDGASPPRSA